MNAYNEYANKVFALIDELENQEQKIYECGKLIANCIESGGIIQAFGSGHSYAAALEISTRAGGFIPSKAIIDPAFGLYEMVEGVGEQLVKQVDLQKEDILVIISNSGRNPLGIEIAIHGKKIGCKIIVITSLEVSKTLKSRHSGNKNLYEYADIVLDNKIEYGDTVIKLENFDSKIGSMSSIAAATLIQGMVLEAIEILVGKNIDPPLYISANVPGGREAFHKFREKYAHRILRK